MSHHQVLPLQNKSESRPISCEYAGGCFRLNEKGLSFIGSDKDGNQLPPRWICSLIKVVAKTRDAKSGEWGRLLEWRDDDGVTHQWAMPFAFNCLIFILKFEDVMLRHCARSSVTHIISTLRDCHQFGVHGGVQYADNPRNPVCSLQATRFAHLLLLIFWSWYFHELGNRN